MECDVQKKLKKNLEERNDFLLSELASLRLVFSQALHLVLRLMPLIKTYHLSYQHLSVSRGPDELEETTAETDPYIFVSSGYF